MSLKHIESSASSFCLWFPPPGFVWGLFFQFPHFLSLFLSFLCVCVRACSCTRRLPVSLYLFLSEQFPFLVLENDMKGGFAWWVQWESSRRRKGGQRVDVSECNLRDKSWISSAVLFWNNSAVTLSREGRVHYTCIRCCTNMIAVTINLIFGIWQTRGLCSSSCWKKCFCFSKKGKMDDGGFVSNIQIKSVQSKKNMTSLPNLTGRRGNS